MRSVRESRQWQAAVDELARYAVAIVPAYRSDAPDDEGTADPSAQGSGTCLLVNGRYFVATAGHVVVDFPATRYAVITRQTENRVLKVVGGGRRGGGQGDARDVAWLELHPRAAAASGCRFLNLDRLEPYPGPDIGDVCVFGAPVVNQVRGTKRGKPAFTSFADAWPARVLTKSEVAEADDSARVLLEWPRVADGVSYPEPFGISGGGVWALNRKAHAGGWHPGQAQMIGIEFAQQKSSGYRYLIAQQIHVWLEMVAEDVPELAEVIRAHLRGAALAFGERPPA